MAIAYSVNGGSEIHGVESTWQRVVKRKNTDGSIEYQPWARNTWAVAEMGMANFEALQALSGLVITSLETNDIDSRNVSATYTSVELEVVNCRHIGLRALDVRLEFRVDVS